MSKNITILLVDDDKELVEMNKVMLEKNGYNVIPAYSGIEGLSKAKSDKPDLIVLDVMMGNSSEGFDLSRSLRKEELTKSIPQIMLTSVNETVPFSFEPDPSSLPVDKFLEKPVEPAKLLSEIEKALS